VLIKDYTLHTFMHVHSFFIIILRFKLFYEFWNILTYI